MTKLTAAGITFDVANGSTGNAVITVNPAGELSAAIADGAGRSVISGMLKQDYSDVVTWNISYYDAISTDNLLITKQADALGHYTESYTDGVGYTVRTNRPSGYDNGGTLQDNITTYTYDENGNLTKVRDPNSVGFDYTYDERNRRLTQADTDTTVAVDKSWTYDANSNVVVATDAKGKYDFCSYDVRDRKVFCSDRNNEQTQWVYDLNSNLVAVWDHNALNPAPGVTGKPTAYTYDTRNLQTAVTYPDHTDGAAVGTAGYGKVDTLYDGLGRRESVTDQLGDTAVYTFDIAGRMTTRTYYANGNATAESQDTFTYDTASRPLTAAKGRYQNLVVYTYDEIGRKSTETLKTQANPTGYTVTCSYDAANRHQTCNYPGGKVITKDYDERNLLAGIDVSGTAVATYGYDAAGRQDSRVAGGITTTYSYRNDNTYSAITAAGKADLSFTYAYDANKNVTGETRTGLLSGKSWTAQFDDDDRITQFDRTGTPEVDRAYTLDKIGNLTNVTRSGVADARAFNEVNEMTTVDNGVALAYDGKGNLTTNKAGQALAWDIDNHLVSITDGAATLGTYTYDAVGRRVSKTVDTDTTTYVCHGNQVVEEYVNGAYDKCYVYGAYIDDCVASIDNTDTITTYHRDRQFNTIALTDSTGAVENLCAYTPYGDMTCTDASGTVVDASTIDNEYWYTGRRLDKESGLWYFRARYFDSAMGTFVSRDPLGYVDGQGLYNGYFAMVMGVDPSGQFGIGLIARDEVKTKKLDKKMKVCCANPNWPHKSKVPFYAIGHINFHWVYADADSTAGVGMDFIDKNIETSLPNGISDGARKELDKPGFIGAGFTASYSPKKGKGWHNRCAKDCCPGGDVTWRQWMTFNNHPTSTWSKGTPYNDTPPGYKDGKNHPGFGDFPGTVNPNLSYKMRFKTQLICVSNDSVLSEIGWEVNIKFNRKKQIYTTSISIQANSVDASGEFECRDR